MFYHSYLRIFKHAIKPIIFFSFTFGDSIDQNILKFIYTHTWGISPLFPFLNHKVDKIKKMSY